MDRGWIKLYRKFIEWEWYSSKNPNIKIVFLHLLLTANRKDKNWQGILIKKGQLVTSYPSLAKDLNLSIQKTRTAISKLLKTKEIVVKSTCRYLLITLSNHWTYQEPENKANMQLTCKQHATNNKQEVKKKEYINNKREDVFHPLAIRVKEELKIVSKLKLQLTDAECERLVKKFGFDLCWQVLLDMENWRDITKKNSVNLTLQKWANNRLKDGDNGKGYTNNSKSNKSAIGNQREYDENAEL